MVFSSSVHNELTKKYSFIVGTLKKIQKKRPVCKKACFFGPCPGLTKPGQCHATVPAIILYQYMGHNINTLYLQYNWHCSLPSWIFFEFPKITTIVVFFKVRG